jgi:hypothetical protein
MLSNAVFLVGAYLAPLAAVWAAVLWMRPAVARARVEREALLIRDSVVDGILSEEIDPTNPRAQDAIRFCDFLAEHSREITLSTLLDTARGLKKAGVDFVAESKARAEKAVANSAGLATEDGQRRLDRAEKDLDNILAFYLVRSSPIWCVLVPAQRVLRLIGKRSVQDQRPAQQVAGAIGRPLPGELGGVVRESARGETAPSALWTAHHGHTSDGRTLAHA